MTMETLLCQQLDVIEVFRFSDGRTVFVGPVHGDLKYIPPCDAELVVNGNVVGTVHLEGEMMPNGQQPVGYRSVATSDVVDLKSPKSDEVCLRIPLAKKMEL